MTENKTNDSRLLFWFRMNRIRFGSGVAKKLYLRNSLRFIVNQFIEAGWLRFEILRNELGYDFASVETADAMTNKIVAQEDKRVEEITGIVDELYPNVATLIPTSLVSRLLGVLKDNPAEPAALSVSSSEASVDGTQPPVIMIMNGRNRSEREKVSEREENEERTKPSRTRCCFFCR